MVRKVYVKGQTVLIPQGVKHRIENKGKEKVVLIEVQTGVTSARMILLEFKMIIIECR